MNDASYFPIASDFLTWTVLYLKELDDELRSSFGINSIQYRILATLFERKREMLQASLAAQLKMPASSCNENVHQLRERDLLDVGPGGVVGISQEGVGLVMDVDDVFEAFSKAFLSSAHPSDVSKMQANALVASPFLGSTRPRNGTFFGHYSIFETLSTYKLLFTKCAQTNGLSLRAFRVLFEIDRQIARGVLPQSGAVARALLLTNSDVSSIIKSLEARQLLERQQTRRDKRAFTLAFTDEGHALFTKTATEMTELAWSGICDTFNDEWDTATKVSEAVISERRARKKILQGG